MSVDQHPLEIARSILLEPAGLSEPVLQRLLGNVLGNAIDYADLYFQNSRQESWVLEDGIIKAGNYNIDYGVGVRAMTGEKTGFAYADDIILPALEQAAMAAKTIAGTGGQHRIQAFHKAPVAKTLYALDNPLASMIDAEKIALLRLLDAEARKADPRVKQVVVNLAGSHDIVLIVASDGTFSADVRPLVRLNVSVIVEEKGRREQASQGGGGRFDYTRFLEADLGLGYAREAVRQALVSLAAEPAPAGMMPVVMG